jgi:hypothetical protein
MASLGKACEACQFFVSVNDKQGHCHGRPPQPFIVPGAVNPLTGQPNMVVQGVYPPVGHGDWCKEFEPTVIGESMPIDRRLAAGTDGQA